MISGGGPAGVHYPRALEGVFPAWGLYPSLGMATRTADSAALSRPSKEVAPEQQKSCATP